MLGASVPDSGCHNEQSGCGDCPFCLIWPFGPFRVGPFPLSLPFALAPALFRPFVCGRALKQVFVGCLPQIPAARPDQGVESGIQRVHTCHVATAAVAVAEIQ
jgi:hypothetical protein